MRHLFIMDPLDKVKAEKDTSYWLMLACHQRGHDVYYADQMDLSLMHQVPFGNVKAVHVHEDEQQPFSIISDMHKPLSDFDVIWVRTDPPFDRRYFYTTLILDFVPDTTRVVNRPDGLRTLNEKTAALYFPEYTPQTLITSRVDEILTFGRRFSRITLKPIDGFAGKGITFFQSGDDVEHLLETTHQQRHQVIAQEYLSAAKQGDKRVLIAGDTILGAILRKHAKGQELNNLDAGGSAHPADLTTKERQISRAVMPVLKQHGIFFVGLDFIGEQLIEVNVTSPTGLRQLCDFNGQPYHHQIIEQLEII